MPQGKAPVVSFSGTPVVEFLEDRTFFAATPMVVTKLSVVNVATSRDVAPLTAGSTIDVSAGKPKISVRADTSGPVGSVRFILDGKLLRTEGTKPYAIANDAGGRYFAWNAPAGTHTLTVVPYDRPYGNGTAGQALSVTFKVVGGVASAPVSPPVSPPASPPVTPPTTPPVSPPATPVTTRSIAWKSTTSSPIARAEAVGAVVDGKLYVMGGFNGQERTRSHGDWVAVKRCDVFDPRTQTWRRIADMPVAFTHASGVVVGKTIWFVGGYEGNHPGPGTNKVWKYDTVANKWSRGPDLPAIRGAGGAALIGNTIYFVSGMEKTRTKTMDDVWALDLNNQAAGWVTKASIPTPRNHLGVAAIGGKLYAVGGQLAQEHAAVTSNVLEVYDPETDQWTRLKNIPVNRSHLTAGTFEYKGQLVFVGGDPKHDVMTREVYGYNPATDAWQVLGLLPRGRATSVAGGLPDGRIISSTGNGPGATALTWIGTLK